MKLDKIKFAHVVAHCVSNGMAAGEYEVTTLDRLIDFEVPEQATIEVYPKNENVERLMKFMAGGTLKIDAIKEHRAITGVGLKESKDAVERYWPDSTKKLTEQQLLKSLDSTQYTGEVYDAIQSFVFKAFKA